jgi:phage head maturation protease
MKKNEKSSVKLTLTKETVANVTAKTGVKAGVVKKLSVSFAVKGEGGACCA